MKKIMILNILIVFGLTSYTQEYKIPDKIDIEKTTHHERIKGTRIFKIKAPGYTFIPELLRFQKDDNTYIQFFDGYGVNFTEKSKILSKEYIESKGAIVSLYKRFKINNYSAIWMDGPSKRPFENKMQMCYGDNDFMVMVVGVYKTSDKEAKNELSKIIASTFYDKDFHLDESELTNFSLDLAGTQFKFTSKMSTMCYYTIDGNGNINNPFQNYFFVAEMPGLKDFSQVRDFSYDQLNRNRRQLQNLRVVEEIKNPLKQNLSYAITFKGNYQNVPFQVYQIVLTNNQKTFILSGWCKDNFEKHISEFKKISQTIKIK